MQKKQNQEMQREGIYAKKSKGQNFLTNHNIIKTIVSNITKTENRAVLEIGPGMGALTSEILASGYKLVCIEIDNELIKYLENKYSNTNIKIVSGDILKVNLDKIIDDEFFYNRVTIISNIPYYITSPIIFKLLKIKNKKIDEIILMMQKEVGERIMAKPNSKSYNSLSLACQFYSDIEKICSVGRNNFIPAPKVDSIVLKFKLNKKYLDIDDEKFINFIRMMFATKRKTILNNLTAILKNKNLATIILNKLKYDFNLRPESLTLNDYYLFFKEVSLLKGESYNEN